MSERAAAEMKCTPGHFVGTPVFTFRAGFLALQRQWESMMKRFWVLALIAVCMTSVGCLRESANQNTGAVRVRLQTGSTETVSANGGSLGGASVAFTGLAEVADVSIGTGTRTDIADFIPAGVVVDFEALNLTGGPASFIAANITVPYDVARVNNNQVWLYTQSGAAAPVRVNTATANAGILSATVSNFSRFWAMTPAAAPTIESIMPGYVVAAGGTTITIKGSSFLVSGGTPTVTVGGVAATNVTVVDSETLTCVTPAGSGAPEVVVTTTLGSGNATGKLSYVSPHGN